MFFYQALDELEGFSSVRVYNELQRIKKVILQSMADGNGTNDYSYISDDLKIKYEEITLVYKKLLTFDLSKSEKYYEETLDSMNQLLKLYNDESISIKKTNIDYQNELKTSNYYIYKQISWRTGELFRKFEVVRHKEQSKGIVPLVVQKYNGTTKVTSDDKRKRLTSLYIGPMDIAFYDFYSQRYFLKNSYLLHELVKYERIIHKRIMFELDFIFEKQLATYIYDKDEFCWFDNSFVMKNLEEDISDHYLSISTKRYGLYFSSDYEEVIDSLNKAWKLWCKRHILFFDYFMAIHYLENENELQTQIITAENELNNISSDFTPFMSAEALKNKLNFFYDLSKKREEYSELHSFYLDIRDNFFESYTDINKRLKNLHKELAKIK